MQIWKLFVCNHSSFHMCKLFAHMSLVVFLTTKPYRCGSFQKIKFTFSACTNQYTKFTTTVISYCAKLFVLIVIPTAKPWYYISLNNSLKHITAIFYLDKAHVITWAEDKATSHCLMNWGMKMVKCWRNTKIHYKITTTVRCILFPGAPALDSLWD